MLNLAKQRILFAKFGFELFTLRLPMRGDIHECDEPERRRSIVVLDDVRIGIGNHAFAPLAFNAEGADAIARFYDGRPEFLFGILSLGLTPQNAPWLAFKFGGSLSGQFFESGFA